MEIITYGDHYPTTEILNMLDVVCYVLIYARIICYQN